MRNMKAKYSIYMKFADNNENTSCASIEKASCADIVARVSEREEARRHALTPRSQLSSQLINMYPSRASGGDDGRREICAALAGRRKYRHIRLARKASSLV